MRKIFSICFRWTIQGWLLAEVAIHTHWSAAVLLLLLCLHSEFHGWIEELHQSSIDAIAQILAKVTGYKEPDK